MNYNSIIKSMQFLVRYIFIFLEKVSPKIMIYTYKVIIESILCKKIYSPNSMPAYFTSPEKTNRIIAALMSRYYSLSYFINFLNCNLKKAYADKVMLNILRYHAYPYRSKVHRDSRSYLALMMTCDMCIFLEDEINNIEEYINSTNISKYNTKLWSFSGVSKLKKLKKLYIFGPFSDVNDCLDYIDRELVIFKPCQVGGNNFHGKVNLFLNQNFSRKVNSDVISAATNPYYKSIFLRNKSSISTRNLDKIKIIKESDRYPGLLAFNRALHSYLCGNSSLNISVTGVNFYLSKYKYSNTYLSIVKKEGYKRNKKLDLISLIEHDLLMNFMFTKRLIKCGSVVVSDSIEFKKIVSMSISNYCNMFSKCNAIDA